MLIPQGARPWNWAVSSQNQLANRRGAGLLLAALAAFASCAPQIKQAEVPRLPSTGDQAQREAVAAQYALTREDKNTWARADGKYSFAALKEVANQFPQSADVFQRTQARATGLSFPANLGGALIGATLGWNLTAVESNRMSTNTQIALYSVGGGLVVLALVLATATHNPADELAGVYNASLRRSMNLQDAAPAKVKTSRLWLPRPNGDGLRWVF